MEGPSKMNIAFKWGGIMGAVLLIISLIFYLTGMVDMETGKSGWLSNILNYVVSIGAVVMGISEYKKAHGDNLTTGEATIIGMLTGIVGGLIMAIYTYVFMTMIAPELLEAIKEQAMANAGSMDNEQEEQAGKMMDMFLSPASMSIMVVIAKFFLGLIVGFVAGLIMKNTAPQNLSSEEV